MSHARPQVFIGDSIEAHCPSMTERASFFVGLADVPKLRGAISRLAGVGYAESLVKERLGLEDLAELQWRCLPIYRSERLASRDPLALAIDLLLLQGTLAVGELEDEC